MKILCKRFTLIIFREKIESDFSLFILLWLWPLFYDNCSKKNTFAKNMNLKYFYRAFRKNSHNTRLYLWKRKIHLQRALTLTVNSSEFHFKRFIIQFQFQCLSYIVFLVVYPFWHSINSMCIISFQRLWRAHPNEKFCKLKVFWQ